MRIQALFYLDKMQTLTESTKKLPAFKRLSDVYR